MGNAALLYDACEKGKVALARVLLDNGAEVDRACEDGRTPLYIACQEGHVDVARLLLERGAVVDSSALCEGDTVEAKYRGRRYYPGRSAGTAARESMTSLTTMARRKQLSKRD